MTSLYFCLIGRAIHISNVVPSKGFLIFSSSQVAIEMNLGIYINIKTFIPLFLFVQAICCVNFCKF
mgnify:CR=1 FL=1